MTYNAAIVIATMILSITLLITIVVVSRRRLAARYEDLRQQASMRGWTFQRGREGAFRVQRWTGTTDGVGWIAESVESNQGGTHGRAAARGRRVTRWKTAPGWTPPKGVALAAPIVIMGVAEGKEKLALSAAPQGDGWAAKLAQKAVGFAIDKAIEAYFGKEAGGEVDAGAMRRVKNDSIPGYVVMSGDPDAATRLPFQGLSWALTSAAADSSSILSGKDRPWILLSNRGLALARLERASSAEHVERFVRAGVALTRSLTAGRQ
jgi:hypothetical protein